MTDIALEAPANRTAQPPPGAPRSVLLSGITADHAVGRLMSTAFGGSARFATELLSPASADLAVGVFCEAESDAADAFDAWAFRAGMPALGVRMDDRAVILGPLARPGRAGCGRCARARLAAARAGAAQDTSDPAPARPHALSADAGAVLVRELAAILASPADDARLLDHVVVHDVATGATSRHRVIPLSRCTVCGGAAAHAAPAAATTALSPDDPPEAVLAALAGWVDPHTGVVSRIQLELSGEAGTELPVIATAAPPHVIGARGELRRLPIGWGKGMTLSGALLSSVGEAIERYAACLPDPDRVIWARADELDPGFLDPRDIALYADAQYDAGGFPFRRFDPAARHPWVLGRWLGSDAPVWVPAVFAFLSLTLHPENQICQGTSNGLAASTDLDDAALRAILELVERDAFMTAWMMGCPGRRLELDDTLDAPLAQIVAGVAALGAQIEIYVLPSSACGTTALCLALGDGERYPGVTLGLGAALDPRDAVRQAIMELAQTGPHLRRMMRSRAIAVPGQPSEVREMLDHAAYYFPAERAAAFDRLRHGAPPVTLRELGPGAPERSLATCAAMLAAANIRVALVDVTSPDVATGPFRVVRAISPALQAISYGHGFDHPPVERIRGRVRAAGVPPIHPVW